MEYVEKRFCELCVLGRKIRINNVEMSMGKASGSSIQYLDLGNKGLLELHLCRNTPRGLGEEGNNSGFALMD